MFLAKPFKIQKWVTSSNFSNQLSRLIGFAFYCKTSVLISKWFSSDFIHLYDLQGMYI